MKKKSMTRAACSFLLVAVLAVMAFIRGPEQFWVLAGVFAIWGVWMLVAGLSSPMVQSRRSAGRLKRKRAAELRQMTPAPASPKEDTDEPIPSARQVMLLHVGHRISAYLKSAYPDAAWEWCGKAPERAIIEGGVLRIRLFNVPDYNYAEIHFDQHANLGCNMLHVVPLANAGKEDAPAPAPQPPDQQPVDPKVWYDLQARRILEDLVADLHSRGYSKLLIKENGDICVQQGEDEVPQERLKGFPARVYWPGVTEVMEKEGLSATVGDNGIMVAW